MAIASDPLSELHNPAFRRAIIADPVRYAFLLLGFQCWQRQAEVLEAIFHHRKVVVHTGHAVGKTYMIPVLLILHMIARPDSLGVVTGASWSNVEQVMKNLRSRLMQLPKGLKFGQPTRHKWQLGPEWYLEAFSPDKPEGIAGKHSSGPSAGTIQVVDEASALLLPISKALMGNMTGENDRLLYIGNPLHADGPFVDAINNVDGSWKVIHISSLDSPNFRDDGIYVPHLASPTWHDEMKREYEEGSPEYKARVLGLVPDITDDTLIPSSLVRACGDEKRLKQSLRWQDDGPLIVSCDPARSPFGDRTTMLVRGETRVHLYEQHRGKDSVWIEQRLDDILDDYTVKGEDRSRIRDEYIDGQNMGGPLCDRRIRRQQIDPTRPHVHQCIAGHRAHDMKRFGNERAEMFSELKDLLSTIAIPPSILAHVLECSTIRFRRSITRDVMYMEDKQEYKKRTGKSPDAADVFALSCVRMVGKKAFPMLDAIVHQMNARPIVDEKTNEINFANLPDEWKRKGSLHRAVWLSRAGESGAVWVHVDESAVTNNEYVAGGCWTVYRVLKAYDVPARIFYEDVLQKSGDEQYRVNTISSYDTSETNETYDITQDIWELMDVNMTTVPATDIKGSRGLEVLDRLLLSALAHNVPDHPYWDDHDPGLYQSPEQMLVWPAILVDDLNRARREEITYTGEEDTPEKEGLIGGGSSLVKCLRMLAVSGVSASV